jgi:E3 ubiquitin-protein ligase HECTD1
MSTYCRTGRDLAEQCIKVLELVCICEAGAMFEGGCLSSVLNLIRDSSIHKDTLHSAVAVVSRLCSKLEPDDACLPICVKSLSRRLQHGDQLVANGALMCLASLVDHRYIRKGVDLASRAENDLTAVLLERLANAAAPRG